MVDSRIKISSILQNQLPDFVEENHPLFVEFLKQYYISVENKSATLDILQNIDKYVQVNNLTNLTESTKITSNVSYFDETIEVVSTNGFPNKYGLIQINNEIITYKDKTETSFLNCVRGFSGVTSYTNGVPDQLSFSKTEIAEHASESNVINLSVLFLKEFLTKVKKQISPGFEGRQLYSNLNENVFIANSKDFYSSKGTNESFRILFRALYGEEVEVIKPSDFLFIPSDAQYKITRDIVVESISGDPFNLINKTLFQDETDLFGRAYGSVNNVKKIQRDAKDYYVLSLDYSYDRDINVSGSIFGRFPIHPTTRVVSSVSVGSSVIDVDSTVGFGTTGSLVCTLQNGTDVKIVYNSKSYNQFYECSGVDQEISNGELMRYDSYAYGYNDVTSGDLIKVRITGVLSDIDIKNNSFLHKENELINIKSLGSTLTDVKSNNWIYNISVSYDVETFTLINSSNYSYRVRTYDDVANTINVGDNLRIFLTDGTTKTATVYSVTSSDQKSFDLRAQSLIDSNKVQRLQRLVSRANSINYPETSIYSTNVQNVYVESEIEPDTLYVSSPSIPSYFEQPLNIKDRSITFSGIFNGTDLAINSHGFYTGDAVYYRPESETNTLNILEGIYFIRKVNDDVIKISRSRSNIQTNNFVTVSGTVTNNKLEYLEFSGQKLSSQKLVRSIPTPVSSSENNATTSGATGILINGVEILNYKSKNLINYGPIESIDILSGGSSYDVSNPPELIITDPVGSGATGYCEVEGSLVRIDVIDGGFDYLSEPIISITGGIGTGAIAKADMISVFHTVPFNSSPSSGFVDLSNNTIAFSTYHKFRDAERVIYRTDGQQGIAGLTTDSSYYVSVQDQYTVKLHKNTLDASVGINTIELTSYGEGTQFLESFTTKKKIGSVNVENPGYGYKSRKTTITSSGINTSNNSINIKNHKYNTGDVLVYSTSGSSIGGMNSNDSYYVTKIDDDSFRLSYVGIGSTSKDFYYNTNQFVELNSGGTGIHSFNYEPINVTITGNIGVSTLAGQDFSARLQSVFRGEIKSVYLENGGVSYGSSEIINYNRQPTFSLDAGSGAEVITVVSDGSIKEVLVTNSGKNYNSVPDLIIDGPEESNGAILTPIIDDNGSLVEVKVINGGFGYSEGTLVTVSSPGTGSELYSNPKKWNINLVERLLQTNLITDDDGIIDNGLNDNYGLQYAHAYSPRKLRQSIKSSKYLNGQLVYQPDLIIRNNKEYESDAHSPIIGWAYDGNPIYGPYGYDTLSGGSIRSMISGYELKLVPNRPSISLYPEGFFIDDYVYTGNGDLDEHNGRFCITPEFPNGVYAYFTTINNGPVESSGAFSRYKKPIFPYFIGNSYKSLPNEFNFDRNSNQDYINPSEKKWLRNTTPYNLTKLNSSYEYLLNPNKIKKQKSIVNNTERSRISRIGVSSGGDLYQVNDVISLDSSGSVGLYGYAKVAQLEGKKVDQLTSSEYTVENIEFSNSNKSGYFVGYSTEPHDFKNLDIVSISGLSTNSIFIQNKFYNIGVSTNILVLNQDISNPSSTGFVTYFSVLGNLSEIRSDDVYQINSEKIKVLSVDETSSRIKVVRQYDGSVGQAHTLSDSIYENSRKFEFFNPNSTDEKFNLNEILYFDPQESVGLGTISGVGIGTTIIFSNPGVGLTQLFIPTKTIYLPNHNLESGIELTYSSGNGNPISISTDGIVSQQLSEGQKLYVANISNDLIGIATNRIGVGSSGSFVGIDSGVMTDTLYFTGIGTGLTHSFKTNYAGVIGSALRNIVTVSTSSTHGLSTDDYVDLNVLSGVSTTIVIKYNDKFGKMVTNPVDFSSGDVDILNNTINITNHGFKNGQKVIHTSSSPSGGLGFDEEYYVITYDKNKIKLATTYYNSTQVPSIEIDITSASSGTISPVNPEINLYKNSIVKFDLSDSSLSYENSSVLYSAFEFDLYTDSELVNKFISSKNKNIFEVVKIGQIGVNNESYLHLSINDFIPNKLYYALSPVSDSTLPESKLSIVNDDQHIIGNNKINIIDSLYKGIHKISGISSFTFDFNLQYSAEKSTYENELDSTVTYTTSSGNAYGPINKVSVLNGGSYKTLPGITSIFTNFGQNASLDIYTDSIGRIKNTNILDIGFEYPTDKTIRPVAKVPQILKIGQLLSFESIGISSAGKNYVVSPDLLVIDPVTRKVDDNAILNYELGDEFVTIIKNTNSLNGTNTIILPVNNSNGVGISTISYDSVSGDVTVGLNVGFSTLSDFPFAVGDNVIIENISVGINSEGKGYNSENYNYRLFTINSVDPNIGGIGATVGYNISNYLSNSEYPGNFDTFNSYGRIVPEKHFPIFNISTKKDNFFVGEVVKSNSKSGIIEHYDPKNNYICISSLDDFEIGEDIIGESSNSRALVLENNNTYAEFNVDSSSIVKNGWDLTRGFLNDNTQRIHDNDYYQYFSYSIKSKIEYEDWKDSVSSLNHTAGFKKFSDLIVESQDQTGSSGITTSQDQGDFIGLSDLISTIDLECVHDFDIANENTFEIGNNIISTEIVLNSKELQDYFESVGNRVLIIDDISQYFNSNPRPTRYSIVDTFLLTDARYRKLFVYVRDQRYFNERQLSIVSLLHDDFYAYINNYGRVETSYDMGYFDFVIFGTEGNLLYYPTKYAVNDFSVSTISHSITDAVSGVGNTSFGNTIYVNSSQTTIPIGLSTSQTIVSIGTSYRATKILVEINDNNYYEVDEFTVIHDGSDVQLLEYGQITTEFGAFSSSGIGTYSSSILGSNLIVNIHPYNTLTQNYTVNTIQISAITGSAYTTTSTVEINSADVGSAFTSITSSVSPTENKVLEIQATNESIRHADGAYIIAYVEDITNNDYQVSEILLIDDEFDVFMTEYGNLETSSGIGTFGANIVGKNLEVYFTPIPNANVEVRLFYNTVSEVDPGSSQGIINLNNANIDTSYGTYTGTERDIRRDFQLTHGGENIFRRVFDGSSSSVVDVENNVITIPNHFFVSGEEVVYSALNSSNPIGIATTTIPGIGSTDKLPSSLYIVKVNDLDVKVSASASDALAINPRTLDITSVGFGTYHTITSKNQNEKVLVSIDNMIQSPVVSSAVTTSLLTYFSIVENIAYFTGISSFFGGDLIKIDDEIMKIESVGFGSDLAILVQRPWMGTGISSHSSDSTVTKINGNYNIVNNVINFYEAPYGPVPIGTATNRPDQRDYAGISTNSTFSGRVFLRSGILNGSEEPYTKNYIFDDLSSSFNGITTQFTLKSNGNDVTGISTSNAIILVRDIFQEPQRIGVVNVNGDYTLSEISGITSISFTGDVLQTPYDVNNSSIPTGGQIISVGSTAGLGYQPLVSAGGTAIVSISGTIQSISIGNSGSGYRSGIQTVNVAVASSSLENYDLEFVGTASISNGNIVSVAITNPGVGYTYTQPPQVIFDAPLSYSNLPAIYSSSSPSGGIGTEAKIDIVVGQGSSVIDFVIKNTGHAYGQGDVLTVAIGGTVGIPTDPTKVFEEFNITVDRTYSMEFNGISIGDLQVLDKIESEFNGEKVKFALRVDGIRYSIRTKSGSYIDVNSTLLVFVNDILQVPGESYAVQGSNITFSEPPKSTDTCKILFYKGTGDVDVVNVDILETVKVGDAVQLNDYDNLIYQENTRSVNSIESTDIIGTNPYTKPGVNRDATYERPLSWCRQRNDKIVNGQFVGKDRVIYEPLINPTSYIIQPIGISDTEFYVDNVYTIFNSEDENPSPGYQNKVRIISQDERVGASATAIVSMGGSVTSIVLSDGGVGYTTTPSITISQPPYATGFFQYRGGKVNSNSYTELGRGYYDSEVVSFYKTYYPSGIDSLVLNLTFGDLRGINFLGSWYNVAYMTKDGDIHFRIQTTFFYDQNWRSKPGPQIKYYPIVGANWTAFYIKTTESEFKFRVEGHNFGSTLSNTPYAIEGSIDEDAFVRLTYVQTSFNLPGSVLNVSGNVVSEPWTTIQGTAYEVFTADFSVVGLNTATATASITAGIVTTISISNAGAGYTFNPPPTVFIEPPSCVYEDVENVSYEGDFGIISGVSTISVGVASTGIVFDLYIPGNSFLRDTNIVGTAVTVSGISTGDYFVVRNSNIGMGLTSLYSNGTTLGIGTQYLDNVYEVSAVSIAQTDAVGYGNTYVTQVTVSVSDYNGLSGIGYSEFFGEYSWGKVIANNRSNPKSFSWYNNGLIGITTSPVLRRTNPLKYLNYNS
jgi:hypothetical protein